MSAIEDLLRLERAGWEALSTCGDAAASFYEKTLATDVVMLLPGGLVIDDRAQAIGSMRGAPWSSFELSDERVLELSDTCAAVLYRAAATRGSTAYEALINSTYVREEGAWRLKLHQQTPV